MLGIQFTGPSAREATSPTQLAAWRVCHGVAARSAGDYGGHWHPGDSDPGCQWRPWGPSLPYTSQDYGVSRRHTAPRRARRRRDEQPRLSRHAAHRPGPGLATGRCKGPWQCDSEGKEAESELCGSASVAPGGPDSERASEGQLSDSSFRARDSELSVTWKSRNSYEAEAARQ